MKVTEIGEFALVELISKIIVESRDEQAQSWQKLLISAGDDAAAWQGDRSIQLATVDALVEGVHFKTGTVDWTEMGWKGLAINLSDIAAMGGIPSYALVSLGLSSEVEIDDVLKFYRNMVKLGRQYGVVIIGGDTDKTDRISITVTVLGSMGRHRHFLSRSTAVPGDKIAVTGYLGAAAAGSEMLNNRTKFGPETEAQLKKAFLHPRPRIAEGQLLLKHGIKTAVDISDGLLSDTKRICQSSHVGAKLELDKIPVAPVVKKHFGKHALELAISGGEDYELLFSGKGAVIERIQKLSVCPVTVIGEITEDINEVNLIDAGGKSVVQYKQGWEHFVSK